MSPLASSGLTWGISGPAFLAGYGGLATAAILVALVVRHRVSAQPAGAEVVRLSEHGHDVAYLNGGPELAVLSALSSMRVAGTIVTEGRGRVCAASSLEVNADELERAIHLAAAGAIDLRYLRTHRIVRTALESTRQRLERAGLMLSAQQRRWIKRAGWGMAPVTALGLARVIAGGSNGAPVGYLLLELAAVGIASAFLLGTVPKRSRRGSAELKRLRATHTELAPKMRPDWNANGPVLAGFGVGIFGASALWASAPAFATDLGAKRADGLASSGYYGGGGCGGGGCGGGGGGCGGGCGGGGG